MISPDDMLIWKRALKPDMEAWLTIPRFRVLPLEFQNQVYFYAERFLSRRFLEKLDQLGEEGDIEEFTYTEEIAAVDLRYRIMECIDKPYRDLQAIAETQSTDAQPAILDSLKSIQVICDAKDQRYKWLEERHDRTEAFFSEHQDVHSAFKEFIGVPKQLVIGRKRQRTEDSANVGNYPVEP